MTPDSLLNDDWNRTIERLGGAAALAIGARDTKAFAWGRKIPNPVVLLRLVLAYCLGEWGLRSTAAWAAAIGLADISNVALLYRLRRCVAVSPAAVRRCIACGGAAIGSPCWSARRSPCGCRSRATGV